jgi:hypothetical protein
MNGSRATGETPSLRWGVVRIVGVAAFVVLLASAGSCGLYLGYADLRFQSGTAQGIASARRLVPGNAAYFEADLADAAALRRAVALNPRLARTWIELGLQAEASGNPEEAERCLLAAARASRTYQPGWTLANFYFRRDEPEKFWPWARRAAEMAYFSQTALYRLCLQVNRDPAVTLARAIPNSPRDLAQYFWFLVQQDELDGAGRVAQKLLPVASPEHAHLFTGYCDRLNAQGRVGAAVQVWNQACERRLLPFSSLDPVRGKSLTNGEFAVTPGAGGFDWKMGLADGVSMVATSTPRALRVSFTGKQPERHLLLQQLVPVMAGRAYRLAYSARGPAALGQTGVWWVVSDPHGGLIASAELRVDDDSWGTGGVSFRVPPGAELVRLSLEYRRPHGSTRMEGDLWLRQLRVEFDQESPERGPGRPVAPKG